MQNTRTMKNKINLFLYLFMLTTSFSHSQSSAETLDLQQTLQQKLDSLQQTHHFPGATFAAVLPNGEIINIATGLADSLTMAPMSPQHRMLSGSNGKTLFMAAALILETNGLYDLDDPISELIGDEAWFHRLPNASDITMRMLLNHTSGIAEYYPLGDFMEKFRQDPARSFEPLESISYVFDTDPLFEAGTDWSYTDTNFLLMAYILEKVGEVDMYQMIREHLLEPYGLAATEPSVQQELENMAVGYSGTHSPSPFHGPMMQNGLLVFNPQFEWAGGGFVSNVADLARWSKELYHLVIISEENREEMRKKVPAKTGEGHYYGLGVQIRPSEQHGFSYGHSGWYPGYVTDAVYFPDADLAVAVQVNTDDLRARGISIYEILMELASQVPGEISR